MSYEDEDYMDYNIDDDDQSEPLNMNTGNINTGYNFLLKGEIEKERDKKIEEFIQFSSLSKEEAELILINIPFHKIDYIWYMTPVLVGKDITEAEFSVTLYINGTETSLDTEGKDNWWYESTGMFDESSAVRIYGGYNEFDDSHKYADHDALTSVSEIKYVITANNINGETGGAAVPELEVVDENPAGEPVVSEPVASDVPTETTAASEGGEQKKDTGLKAAKVIAGVVIMLAGACYAVILVRKMKR